MLIELYTGSDSSIVEAGAFNDDIWLCWSESVVRFGKNGSKELQSGTSDEKVLMSMMRVLTDVKRT